MANKISAIWTKTFWLDTGDRVISTAAQAAVGVLVAGGLVGLATSAGLITIATAAALSFFKAVAVATVTDDEKTLSPASPVPVQEPETEEIVDEGY